MIVLARLLETVVQRVRVRQEEPKPADEVESSFDNDPACWRKMERAPTFSPRCWLLVLFRLRRRIVGRCGEPLIQGQLKVLRVR